jgi:hypothetical protein
LTQLPSNLPENMLGSVRLPNRPVEMTESDYDLLLSLARKVERRGMGVPAIFFLESAKPLNYIGAQAMVFFGPMVRIMFESPNYYRFTELLENRDTVELLLRMIEGLVDETDRRQYADKKAKKKHRKPFWKFWGKRPN